MIQPRSHYERALAMVRSGSWTEAESLCRELLAEQPARGEAWQLLGVIAHQDGRHDVAIDALQRAISVGLRKAETFNNLGAACQAAGRLDEAIDSCRRALEIDPDHGDSWRNLGFFLQRRGELPEAEAACRRALQVNPKNALAYNTLGNILQDQNRFDEAIACYQSSAALCPNDVKAIGNLGNALTYQGRIDEALAWYERAIGLRPDYPDAHLHRAMLWLLRGDFQRGWPEYEWRYRSRQFVNRVFTEPRWDGRPLPGGTLLLHAEQGFGDTLQFIRYAALVRARVGSIVVACPRPLCALLATCPGVDRVVAQDAPLPPIDAQISLLSVPGVLQTHFDSIPRDVPYLHADAARIRHWQTRLAGLDGYRIGIAWQGSPTHAKDARRSIALRHFAALARVPGVRLISLQKHAGTEQLAAVQDQFPVTTLGESVDADGAFLDTAAILQHLDLVISSDTSVAHLAGALAVPVCVALPVVPDWRWLLDRSDSPWYPSMQLFRQQRWGDWGEVFERIAAWLRAKLNRQ